MHALELSGLDSLTKLLPLAPLPSDGLGLISTAEMREVAISLDASLHLALPASWPVTPPPPLRLRLRLRLASLGLTAAGRLALRPAVVGALPLRALAFPGCLASAVALAAFVTCELARGGRRGRRTNERTHEAAGPAGEAARPAAEARACVLSFV